MIYNVIGYEIDGDRSWVSDSFTNRQLAEHCANLLNQLEDEAYPNNGFYVSEQEENKSNITLDSYITEYYSYSINESDLEADNYNDDEKIKRIYDNDQYVLFNKINDNCWYIEAFSIKSYEDAKQLAWDEYNRQFE